MELKWVIKAMYNLPLSCMVLKSVKAGNTVAQTIREGFYRRLDKNWDSRVRQYLR